MSEAAIIRALQQGVTAAVAASTMPNLSVKYLDVKFTEPDSGKWLEVVWFPNNRLGDFWGDEKNHRGMLRLILHWPNEAAGVYRPLALIESIAGYFTKGKMLSNVQIYEKADYTGGLLQGDETLHPVSIRYQSYVP